MLRFFNLVSQGSAMNKTCIPVFLAMSLFNAANALSVTLTGEAEISYELSGGFINVAYGHTMPKAVIAGGDNDLSYVFEVPLNPDIPSFLISHGSGTQLTFRQNCEEIYNLDLSNAYLYRPDCTNLSFSDVGGWDITLINEPSISLTSPTAGTVVAIEGSLLGVSMRGALGLGANNPFIIYTDSQVGPLGVEVEVTANNGLFDDIHNRLELYSTVLGPRVYVEYEGDMFTEFGAKLGAFQFAGTLSDGDAFNDLEVEWSTDLAEGLALEGQMRFGGTFQASLMTHLSF